MNARTSQRITTRNDIARDIIAGFASVAPTLAGVFRFLDSALADMPAVLAELRLVRAELEAVRLDRANLIAAMRATIDRPHGRGSRPLVLPARRAGRAPGAPTGPPGDIMSGYRQMRRHARQARRAGMQPMMVINSGDPFPELAIVVIARLAWRYRSELAPVAVTGALAGVGAWLHGAYPGAAVPDPGCLARPPYGW